MKNKNENTYASLTSLWAVIQIAIFVAAMTLTSCIDRKSMVDQSIRNQEVKTQLDSIQFEITMSVIKR